jgi:hypothetical protein
LVIFYGSQVNKSLFTSVLTASEYRKEDYMTVTDSKLLTVKQFCEKHSWPSESALRALILDAPDNGFLKVFKRVGRRVLVDEKAFWDAVDRLQEVSDACSR